MEVARGALTILMIGAIGAIVYTLATNSGAISAFFTGADNLYRTAEAGSLGRVA